jgi:hypothetical protein
VSSSSSFGRLRRRIYGKLVGLLVPSYFPNAFEHDIGENKRQNAIQQPTQQTKRTRRHELLSIVTTNLWCGLFRNFLTLAYLLATKSNREQTTAHKRLFAEGPQVGPFGYCHAANNRVFSRTNQAV